MGNPLERKKSQEKTLLAVTGPLAEKNIEVQKIRIGSITYKFPSPEAVESELLEIFGRMDKQDSAQEHLEFQNFIRRLVDTMKEARRALDTARQQHEQGNETLSKSDLRIARGKFIEAQGIMGSQGLEEPRGIKEILDYEKE